MRLLHIMKIATKKLVFGIGAAVIVLGVIAAMQGDYLLGQFSRSAREIQQEQLTHRQQPVRTMPLTEMKPYSPEQEVKKIIEQKIKSLSSKIPAEEPPKAESEESWQGKLPQNYILVSRTTKKAINIDANSVTETTPVIGTGFQACVKGTKDAEISSAAFDLTGDATLKMRILKNSKSLWQPMTVYPSWPGDFLFGFTETVKAGKCMELSIELLDVTNNNPNWAQFHIRGMQANLPVYGLQPNGNTWEISNQWVAGSIDVFKQLNQTLMVLDCKWNQDQTQTMKPGEAWVHKIGHFNISSLINSQGNPKELTFFFETTYQKSLAGYVHLYYELNPKFPFHEEIPLSYAPNQPFKIPLNQNFYNGSALVVEFYINETPAEEGTIQIILTDMGQNITSYQGCSTWFTWENKSFTEKKGILTYITDKKSDPIINLEGVATFYPFKLWKDAVEIQGKETPLYTISLVGTFAEKQKQTIEVSPFSLIAEGSFQSPIKVRVSMSNAAPTDYSLLPGTEIPVPKQILTESNTWFPISITMLEYPASMKPEVSFLRFKIPSDKPVTAIYLSDGINVKKGDNVPIFVNIFDQEKWSWEWKTDYIYPLRTQITEIGPTKLFEAANYNSLATKNVFLSDYDPKKENTFTMNNVCFEAQGKLKIKKAVYNHFTREISPFTSVILSTWSENAYLSVENWKKDQAIFPFTKPIFLNHGNQICFELKVLNPLETVEEAYFHLVSIEAETEQDGLTVPTITKTGKELSGSNPIEGGKFNFYP